MKFDVMVVGAGTAGCLAAKTAAEAGLKVCLVERKAPKGDWGESLWRCFRRASSKNALVLSLRSTASWKSE
jgi:choline dehydrogenase-like flavoprotein